MPLNSELVSCKVTLVTRLNSISYEITFGGGRRGRVKYRLSVNPSIWNDVRDPHEVFYFCHSLTFGSKHFCPRNAP